MSMERCEISYNHSRLKVPVDSCNEKTLLKCDRLSSLENCLKKEYYKNQEDSTVSNYCNDLKSVKSYLEFYESIPDYTDLHHLSNEEFYTRLKKIKITQKKFCDESGVRYDNFKLFNFDCNLYKNDENKICCSLCCADRDFCNGIEEIKKKIIDDDDDDGGGGGGGGDDGDGKQRTQIRINGVSDCDNNSEICESELKKHSDYDADRESSTLQVASDKLAGIKKYFSPTNIVDDCLSGSYSKRSRSLPFSSGCDCETPEACNRFSEFHFRNERFRPKFDSGYYTATNEKTQIKKTQSAQSRTIPITSRIPLYDKLMFEKERRRRILHERYSEKLKSLVQPFSFTKREEENRKLLLARSNPELYTITPPTVKFKAKPVPKNLFSNYAYDRMKEEEFYRALKKRIRAEEMLKISSLPPSMALREKQYLSKSLDYMDFKNSDKNMDLKSECNTITRDLSKLDIPKKKCFARTHRKNRRINSMTDSSAEISPYESILNDSRRKTRPHSAFNPSRNNLASVLRIETARKRMEKEMEEKLEESRLKYETKLKERLIRMTPEWKALKYDKEQDFAVRMALRREENKTREENHLKSMESMYGRVYSMPPLFDHERFHNSKNWASREKSLLKIGSTCDFHREYNKDSNHDKTEECDKEKNYLPPPPSQSSPLPSNLINSQGIKCSDVNETNNNDKDNEKNADREN